MQQVMAAPGAIRRRGHGPSRLTRSSAEERSIDNRQVGGSTPPGSMPRPSELGRSSTRVVSGRPRVRTPSTALIDTGPRHRGRVGVAASDRVYALRGPHDAGARRQSASLSRKTVRVRIPSASLLIHVAVVAQRAERRSCKPRVAGSTPAHGCGGPPRSSTG